MSVDKTHNLFGSSRRTAIMILLRLLETSYPSELARLLGAPLFSVQKIVEALESEGVVVSNKIGNTRQVRFNPRYVCYKELRALLWKLGQNDVKIQRAAAKKRRRPRRKGKPG